MLKPALFWLSVLCSSLAHAAPVEALFEELKDSGAHFEIVGMVCEKVAVLELEDDYPPARYEIVNGIVYGDKNRTIGELDVVVFDRSTREAVLVAEVKCWKSLQGARRKALDQRQRFKAHIGKNIEMYDGENRSYSSHQFRNVRTFISIAQNGAASSGFEMELENSLSELMKLRQMLMRCQDEGRCERH